MTEFEEGQTSMFMFMQYMEDILKHIDEFTCGHNMVLDIVSGEVPKTSFRFEDSEVKTSQNRDDFEKDPVIHNNKQSFTIRREMNDSTHKQNITILLKLFKSEEGEKKMVKSCSLSFSDHSKSKNIVDKAMLRDKICGYFVPVLRIFSILHFVLMSCEMKAVVTNSMGSLSPFCMQLKQKPHSSKSICIALNKEDKLVTWEAIGESKEMMQIWKLETIKHEEHLSKDALLFLSYVIGTHKKIHD